MIDKNMEPIVSVDGGSAFVAGSLQHLVLGG